jgi:hypothetical protein
VRGTLLERLDRFVRDNEAEASIFSTAGDGGLMWGVSITWGREAPDSNMAGAQALGMHEELEESITQALEQAGC